MVSARRPVPRASLCVPFIDAASACMSHRYDRPPVRTNARVAFQDPILYTPASSSASSSRTRNSTRKLPSDGALVAGEEVDDMEDRRPPLHRPSDARSHQPLLDEERGRTGYKDFGSARSPVLSRRSTFRSRSPDTQAQLETRKKYTYAAIFLGLSLVSFTVQTETARYIQQDLGWDKAYCML